MKKEKTVVVDQYDNIIGSKYRDEIDYKNDIRRSAGIWITNSSGQILIAQRSIFKKIDSGKWGPSVQGSIEEGETYEQNAYKELEEELGLHGFILETYKKQYVDFPMKYFSQWFLLKIDQKEKDFVIQKKEVENIRWIDRDLLLYELKNNPEKYVPSMLEIFYFLEKK